MNARTILLLCLLELLMGNFSFGQNDSAYIEMYNPKNSLFLEAVYSPANSFYELHTEIKNYTQKYISNHLLINPRNQIYNGILRITSFENQFKNSGVYYPKLYDDNLGDFIKGVNKAKIFNFELNPDFYHRIDTYEQILFNITKELRFNSENFDSTWTNYKRLNFKEEFPAHFDSLNKHFDSIKQVYYQPFIDSILIPFYFSQTEISNSEYREFIHWVRDSVLKTHIYLNCSSDALAYSLLNLSKKERKKLKIGNRNEYLKLYGLNGDDNLDLEDLELIPWIKSFYFPQPERFYKRREIDYNKIRYRLNDTLSCLVYPDTLSFSLDEGINYNYFWHPYYGNFPVLGISYLQAEAFCKWKTSQLNKTLKDENFRVCVSIPSLYDYEMALKSAVDQRAKNTIEITQNSDFQLNIRPNEIQGIYLHAFSNQLFGLTKSKKMKSLSFEEKVCEVEKWKYNQFSKSILTSDFPHLIGNASEYCSSPISAEFLDYYKIETQASELKQEVLLIGQNYKEEIINLNGNQLNTLFYMRTISKEKPSGIATFRTVVRFLPK